MSQAITVMPSFAMREHRYHLNKFNLGGASNKIVANRKSESGLLGRVYSFSTISERVKNIS